MRTPSRRFVLLLVLGGAVWCVVAIGIVPALIRAAYAGNSSFAPLNGIIKGQTAHPVAFYLGLWRQTAAAISVAILVALAVGTVASSRLKSVAGFAARALRSTPTIQTSDTVRIAAFIGFIGGLTETLSLAGRFLLDPDPREAPPIDALWMAPLATAILGALVGVLLALLLRAWRGISITIPIALLAGFAVFSVIRVLKIGVHPYAIIILGAGIALELARRSRVHSRGVTVFVRRALPWLAASTLAGALIIQGVSWARERSALRRAGATPPGAPNVLLLILDTVRADDMGLYGYARNTSPEIERVAATGVTFDHAIVSAPWTLPSHASMFTGLAPHKLSTDFDRPLDGVPPTLAEVLRRRGYTTGGFVANPTYAARATGLNRGFATYRDHEITINALIDNAFWPRRAVLAIRDALGRRGRLVRRTAAEVNREVLDWMPADGRPFFAFLNYFDAHEPYETHPPFDRLFSKHPPKYWLLTGWQRNKSRADLQEIRNAYDSNIAYIDHHIGELLRALDRRGLLKNTIVVITSDHGEQFGEHGGIMSHANSLYLPLLHVPLVISYPPRLPVARRIAQPVSLQNIAATVLDLAAVGAGAELPGESMRALWSAPADSVGPDGSSPPALLSELTFNTFSNARDPIRKGPMQSLVQGKLHYIRNGDGREELYDFEADPGELEDLARSGAGEPRLRQLRRMMDEQLGESARTVRSAPRKTRAAKRKAARDKAGQ
jgi:arylsulfatase A-like enzyme